MPWLVYQSKDTLNLLMDLVTDALLTTKHLTLACLIKQMTDQQEIVCFQYLNLDLYIE